MTTERESLFAPIYESLTRIEAEARMHESSLSHAAPYWWQGRGNHAAIVRGKAQQLRRDALTLERELEKARER